MVSLTKERIDEVAHEALGYISESVRGDELRNVLENSIGLSAEEMIYFGFTETVLNY